jgi:hypothetical protein
VQALSKLNQGGNETSKLLFGEDWEEDEDDDADEYTSPIDEIDELLFFSDTFKAAFQREPELFQHVQDVLSSTTLESCQKLFLAADEQRAKGSK